MITKRLLLVSFAFFAVLLILTGCSNEPSPDESSSNDSSSNDSSGEEATNEENVDEITATNENTNIIMAVADSTYFFESAEEIVPEASIMVTGEVVETEGFVYSGDNGETFQIMTLVKVRVEKDYLNQIQSGSEVYFIEPGGTVPTSEIPPRPEKDFNAPYEEPVSEYTQVLYNQTPNSKVGDQVLFFGVVEEDFYNLNLGEPYYSAIGSEQSRFVLDTETNEYVRPLDEATGTNAPIVIKNEEEVLTSLAEIK